MTAVFKERASNDRRVSDQGPPDGWKDRRRFAERRQIAVAEVSFEEWMIISGSLSLSSQHPESPSAFDNPPDR